MHRSNRIGVLLVNALFVSSVFLALVAGPAAATAGRNAPGSAAACEAGSYESPNALWATDPAWIGPNYVVVGPPVEEDYFRCSLWQGQIFQAVLWADAPLVMTVLRSDGTSLVEELSTAVGQPNFGFGQASVTLVIYRTEPIYLKISPPVGAAPSTTPYYYNLYTRAYNATVLSAGSTLTSAANNESIHGWDYASGYGYRYIDDYYWINATDATGGNHQNYRVTLTADCSTAMYDLFVYQFIDYPSERLDLVNHSFAMERRLNRLTTTSAPNVVDFAPVFYNGLYLLRVHAAENGSFSLGGSPNRYHYSLGVTTVGGYAKDFNDHIGDGELLTITGSKAGHIDGRDDNVDFVRLQLLAGDRVTLGLQFSRDNSEITTLGMRFRVIVWAPNGTVMADADNWGISGGNLFFNPYITVPEFIAGENGTYHVGIFATDGALNYIDPHLINTGGVGKNFAGWTLTANLPNRPPYANASAPLPETITFDEDGQFVFSMAGSYIDPEGKIGYPTYGPVTTSANITATIGSGVVRLTAAPDWYGNDYIVVTVKDDYVPTNNQPVRINVTVRPVNDAPRKLPSADNYSVVFVNEDGSATVPMRSLFYDVDDSALEFTASGLSGKRVAVVINNVSQVATITPDLNWNGELDVTWTATDPQGLIFDFVSHVIVQPVNDPPRATDTRLPRIVIDEGQDYFINLTQHFYDFDDGDQLRYYGAVDPSVAEYIRVNNTNLDPRDPNMRVYVVDQYRSNYFTNGPVPIKFWVLDSSNNVDGTNGIPVVVEKSTFLEIVNVNDPPIVDEIQPSPSEVAINQYHEGDSITFAVTRVVDPDNTFYPETDNSFLYRWYVNGEEVVGQTGQTFVFRTVLDATQTGQYAEGHYVVTVEVTDAGGKQAAQTPEWEFTVFKTNRPPQVQVLRPQQYTFEEGSKIQFQALMSDEDPEDNLTIVWTYRDANQNEVVVGDVEQFTRLLDPGTYTVTVTVSDGITTVSREVQLTVTEHKLNTPGFEGAFAAVALGAVALAAVATRGRRRAR